MLCWNLASIPRQVACDDIRTDLDCSCMSAPRWKHTHNIKREQFHFRYAKIPEKEPRSSFLLKYWLVRHLRQRSYPYLIATTLLKKTGHSGHFGESGGLGQCLDCGSLTSCSLRTEQIRRAFFHITLYWFHCQLAYPETRLKSSYYIESFCTAVLGSYIGTQEPEDGFNCAFAMRFILLHGIIEDILWRWCKSTGQLTCPTWFLLPLERCKESIRQCGFHCWHCKAGSWGIQLTTSEWSSLNTEVTSTQKNLNSSALSMTLLSKWRSQQYTLYNFHRYHLYISPLHILVQLDATLQPPFVFPGKSFQPLWGIWGLFIWKTLKAVGGFSTIPSPNRGLVCIAKSSDTLNSTSYFIYILSLM